MKLLRYGNKGEEKPGVLDEHGNIRDLFHYLTDIDPKSLADPSLLMQLNALDHHHLPLVSPDVRIGPCVGAPGKLICVGFNSALHTEQMGIKPIARKDMVVFLKASSSICGPFDPILYTRHMKKLDWEAELGVVIGRQGKYIKQEDARGHIFGYTCINDLSERFLQLETEDTQFTKGKCFDNAAPMGPYLVTKDEIQDASNLDVKLWVNGMLRQDFHTSDYLHNAEAVVSYLSQYFTLYPGDVISMGSAPGNAISWGDDQFLMPNDNVVLLISGLGEQRQTVIVEPC